jgi:hypothetical protein
MPRQGAGPQPCVSAGRVTGRGMRRRERAVPSRMDAEEARHPPDLYHSSLDPRMRIRCFVLRQTGRRPWITRTRTTMIAMTSRI